MFCFLVFCFLPQKILEEDGWNRTNDKENEWGKVGGPTRFEATYEEGLYVCVCLNGVDGVCV